MRRLGRRVGRTALPTLLATARRLQSGGGFEDDDELLQELQQQAERVVDTSAPRSATPMESTLTQQYAAASEVDVILEKLPRAPAQFDLVRQASVYKWKTKAKYARKVTGPMREWADEFQCRTGVFVTMDAEFPERAAAGQYDSADDVDVNLFFFGADKAVTDSIPLLKAMTALEPAYVRVGLYRKKETGGVEWLMLRRINRERRPPDIPAISLKTPGKYTMLFENPIEAITRSVFEETGIDLDAKSLIKTNVFSTRPPQFFWRPNVHYYVAELPEDGEVLGPQSAARNYMMDWDSRILRQSSDPIDRAWATQADPKTGCAWLPSPLIDDLQKPVKLEDAYMAMRYTVPPASGLQELLTF
jgi:8-oxo-dGTP pyrophosphatase MutT (NUDIX family)